MSGAPRCVPVDTPGRRLLLLFLGSDCGGCGPFWPAAGAPQTLGLEPEDDVVVVVRPPPREDVHVLQQTMQTAGGCDVVLSALAWSDYRVQGPPFYVLVDGARVMTEGVAWSVGYVAEDVGRFRRGSSRDGTERGAAS